MKVDNFNSYYCTNNFIILLQLIFILETKGCTKLEGTSKLLYRNIVLEQNDRVANGLEQITIDTISFYSNTYGYNAYIPETYNVIFICIQIIFVCRCLKNYAMLACNTS